MLAHITLTDNKLTPDSTCTINGQTVPVPERHEQGGILAPLRIIAALRSLGYRPASGNYYASLASYGDHCTVRVEEAQ